MGERKIRKNNIVITRWRVEGKSKQQIKEKSGKEKVMRQ
jgi:hypothetical protein